MAGGSGSVIFTWVDVRGATRVLIFGDCILSDSYTDVNTPTLLPMETGIKVTDHVRQEPRELNITAFVSNSPLTSLVPSTLIVKPAPPPRAASSYPVNVPQPPPRRNLQGLADVVLGVTSVTSASPTPGATPVVGISSVEAFGPEAGRDFVKEAMDELSEMMGRRSGTAPAQIIVTSTKQEYPGFYFLKECSPSRAVEDGDGGTFTMSLVQARFSTLKQVPTPNPTAIRATKKITSGKQNPSPVDSKQKVSQALNIANEAGVSVKDVGAFLSGFK